MASTAQPSNQLQSEVIQAFLDRFEGMEDEAQKIMMTAMAECKSGPRQDQKDLRAEVKHAGIRMKTFNAMLTVRKKEREQEKALAALEGDDRDQLIECAQALGGAFGEMLLAKAG